MKKLLLALTLSITSIAAGTSIYLANLKNPTDIQTQFGNTTNTIATAGAIAIFGLLDDDQD